MRPLPKGWRWVKIREHTQEVASFNPRTFPDEKFNYIDITSVDNTQKRVVGFKTYETDKAPSRAKYIVGENDIIVSTVRPNLNAVALINKDQEGWVCSSGFCVVRLRSDQHSQYYFRLLTSPYFINRVSALVQGAMYPAISDSDVLETPIPLPPTSDKQIAIASELERKLNQVESMRQTAKRQFEAAEAIRMATIRDVFAGLQDTKPVPVRQVTKLVIDGPHVTPEYTQDGIPFVTVLNIRHRQLDFTGVKSISHKDHKEFCKRGKAERGDILMTKDGTLGVPCLVTTEKEFSFFVSVALLKPDCGKILPEYLFYALDSPLVRKRVDERAAGAGLKHIVIQEIKSLEIPFLQDKGKQQEIVRTLDKRVGAGKRMEQASDKLMEAVQALPGPILRQAFDFGE